MSRNGKIGFAIGTVALMIIIVWFFSSGEKADYTKRKTFVSSNWTKKFQINDKKPLGLYLFTQLTKAHLNKGKEQVIITDWIQFDTLIKKKTGNCTFLFVGSNFGLKNSEMDTILDRVNGGSDLFLSFNDLTENLYPKLFDRYETQFDYSSSINIFAGSNKHNLINLYQNDTIACEWKAFGNIKTYAAYESLSSFMQMDNFIKIPFGEGHVYIHTTPAAFYNYQVKRKAGFKYTEYTLNQLPKDQDVFLLELGRLSDNYGNEDTDTQDGADGKEDDSYLKLIFQNPTLLTALLLTILGVILFVIFRSKRTRPIVPFIEQKKDMTLAFAETITSIYFAKRNPYGLLQVQKKNFYATVHKHFFVDIQRRENDKPLEILAEKSDTSLEDIIQLVAGLETKEAHGISEQYVTNILQKQHAFYKRVGIISNELSEKIQEHEFIFKRALLLPILFIGAGLFLIVFGVYYLMSSIGIGIVLWPVGILLLVLGILRMSKPYLKINKEKITHYSALGIKKEHLREDLISTEVKTSGAVLHFKNNKQLIINYWDLSRFDQKQFKRLISKLHKLEL